MIAETCVEQKYNTATKKYLFIKPSSLLGVVKFSTINVGFCFSVQVVTLGKQIKTLKPR